MRRKLDKYLGWWFLRAGNPRPDHTPDERNSRTSHQRTQLTLIEGPDPWGPWRWMKRLARSFLNSSIPLI